MNSTTEAKAAAHTPGPWIVYGPYKHVEPPDICDIGTSDGTAIAEKVALRNARLIASAPQLLQSHRALVSALGEAAEYIWSRPRYGYSAEASAALEKKVDRWRAALAAAKEVQG